MTRQPRAFRLDDPDVVTVRADEPAPERRGAVVVTEEPIEAIEAADGALVPLAPRRGLSWVGVLMSALGGLVTLALGLGLERLIVDLFVASPVLGWVALGLALVALVAFLAVVVREIAGMFRERRIEKLREAAIDAIAVKDHEAAKRVVRDLITLYGERTHTAAGRKRLTAWADEIIEADDRIALAERELVAPLDLAAKRAVAGAAKQVSVVTAISPRAIVDVAFVIFAAVRLLRRISMIYGGRPGLLGFLRLARAAFGHLAVTGGVAVGDSIVQQVLGLGLAARISAKLGEGVLNGLMTARFGLAAIAVCRPLPFLREEPPRLGDVAGELLDERGGGGAGPLRSFPPLFGARLRRRAAGRAVGFVGYRRSRGAWDAEELISIFYGALRRPRGSLRRLPFRASPLLPASGLLRHVRRSLVQGLRDLSAVGSPHRTLALPEVSAQARSDASGHLPIRFQPSRAAPP